MVHLNPMFMGLAHFSGARVTNIEEVFKSIYHVIRASFKDCTIRSPPLLRLFPPYIVVEGAKAIGEFRNFRKLRELQLVMGMMTDDNLMDIYSFFKLCEYPRLEKLFIEVEFLAVLEGEPPEVDFECLKTIKINNFKGHINEMWLVNFLLEKASSLESLVVVAPKELVGDELNKNMVDGCPNFLHFFETQLTNFTRGSVSAHITLSEHGDRKFCPTHCGVYSLTISRVNRLVQ
ncbi:F-box/LRR-repeat protein [Canna indica]|uniref:F-box/LRR-repeat protein n=1 Tax=Canna indica TaxID=4628 RepID=A0AAQ3KKE6_9LILI|nr:F-box/LRR-repeat protein [Canna indica]